MPAEKAFLLLYIFSVHIMINSTCTQKCTGTYHSNTVLLYNYRSLQAVIERIDTNAHDLQSLHTIVQSKHSTSLDDRETAAKTRDQQLTSRYLTIINTGSGCLLLLYC